MSDAACAGVMAMAAPTPVKRARLRAVVVSFVLNIFVSISGSIEEFQGINLPRTGCRGFSLPHTDYMDYRDFLPHMDYRDCRGFSWPHTGCTDCRDLLPWRYRLAARLRYRR